MCLVKSPELSCQAKKKAREVRELLKQKVESSAPSESTGDAPSMLLEVPMPITKDKRSRAKNESTVKEVNIVREGLNKTTSKIAEERNVRRDEPAPKSGEEIANSKEDNLKNKYRTSNGPAENAKVEAANAGGHLAAKRNAGKGKGDDDSVKDKAKEDGGAIKVQLQPKTKDVLTKRDPPGSDLPRGKGADGKFSLKGDTSKASKRHVRYWATIDYL